MKKLLAAAAIAVALLAAGAARAGMKSGGPTVTFGSNYAYGALGSARNTTADSIEYIGCYTIAAPGSTAGTSTGWGYCYAYDRTGAYHSCLVNDPVMLAALQSLKGDGMLTFYWDASGKCTYLYVYTNSAYEPKAP